MSDEGNAFVLNVNIGFKSFIMGVNECVCLNHYCLSK